MPSITANLRQPQNKTYRIWVLKLNNKGSYRCQ